MGDVLKVVKELAESTNVLRILAGFGAGWICKEIYDNDRNNRNDNDHNDNKRLNDKN